MRGRLELMTKRQSGRLAARVFSGLSFLGLVSCTALDTRPPEERIGERALRQAQALLEGDYDTAVQYTTPSYRDSEQARFYAARHSGAQFWNKVELRWVKCDQVAEPDRCSVRIWIYNNPPIVAGRGNPRALGNDVPVSWDKLWIQLDNEWYQYP